MQYVVISEAKHFR